MAYRLTRAVAVAVAVSVLEAEAESEAAAAEVTPLDEAPMLQPHGGDSQIKFSWGW